MPNTVLAMGYASGVRLAAAGFTVKLGDPAGNAEAVIRAIRRAQELGADYLTLPELCLTGATLGSLLNHPVIIDAAKAALEHICEETHQCSVTAAVGLPYTVNSTPMSCIALVRMGRVVALIPAVRSAAPFGFMPSLERCGVERSPLTPVAKLAAGFAGELFSDRPAPREGYVMLISSACNATAKSLDETLDMLESYTARTGMAVAYAAPGRGESTTSFVFDGLCAVAVGGKVLASSKPFEAEPFVYADVQTDAVSPFEPFSKVQDGGMYISADPEKAKTQLARILELQASALVRRAEHIGCRGFVIGVSGGLDSALALLASCSAADAMNMPRSAVLGISMPGFGTSSRTKNNSKALVNALGCEYREISVARACRVHFEDVGHDESVHDSVYENAQARERTKILLSIANGEGKLDVGTGDLSEAALGWTTFGGDHLAQYGVNASIPKTIIRRVVERACERFPEAADILRDILATPVSPELLPPVDGVISQRTEDLIGDYELHDLFIYHLMQGGSPQELYDAARTHLTYPEEEVYRVLGIFLKRFFSQQFKRNCAPEAPEICLSIGAAAFDMPSDMSNEAFMREYKRIRRA